MNGLCNARQAFAKRTWRSASLLALGVGLLTAAACREHRPSLPASARAIAEQVRAAYCPDSRLHVFHVDGWQVGNQIVLRGETTSPEAHAELLQKLRQAFPRKRLVDEIRVLPDSTVDSSWAIVNLSVANLRREPSHVAELLNQMLLGSVVRLYKRQRDWYFVRTEDGYLGWTDDGGIWCTDSTGVVSWLVSPRVIVTALETLALASPEEGAQPVSDLVAGDVLLRLAAHGSWLQIRFPDGRTGWVRRGDVSDLGEFLRAARPTPENIVVTALRLFGRPYLWGGTSPKGLDCSGFTCTVFRLNGVILPRDANMQVKVGAEVPLDSSLSAAQPGDLVFFGPSPERITHVGIYLGDGKFIHSDSHVRINSLRPGDADFSPYRYRNLRAVRRVVSQLRRDEMTGWYRVGGLELPRAWQGTSPRV
jgi:cell wall-associated NlpC family hydrolase